MRLLPLIFMLILLTCCGPDREQNSIRVKFTDIDGKVFDTNEKRGEYLKVKASDGILVLERVQVDGSRSRFEFSGTIVSQSKHKNQQVYRAKSDYGESIDKFILFGVDRENNTIDSMYQDYGADYHAPQVRLTKIYGDIRWEGN